MNKFSIIFKVIIIFLVFFYIYLTLVHFKALLVKETTRNLSVIKIVLENFLMIKFRHIHNNKFNSNSLFSRKSHKIFNNKIRFSRFNNIKSFTCCIINNMKGILLNLSAKEEENVKV